MAVQLSPVCNVSLFLNNDSRMSLEINFISGNFKCSEISASVLAWY